MVFVFSAWEKFCSKLKDKGLISVPAKEVLSAQESFLVLKHDIENTVVKAYKLAEIENKYGHRGTYYIHAHLLNDPKNVTMLKKMQEMGHEISYHYDVMDSCRGDMERAKKEFKCNLEKFEALGFQIRTVCQHGNPIVERVGYTSNRDFFRSAEVQRIYPDIADIMVNYKDQYKVEYAYYSDAGRKFKLIYDPINNDIVNSDDKNISYESLDEMLVSLEKNAIISTHPHRWTQSAGAYLIKEKVFQGIKRIAKLMIKVPFLKKIMSRYYYLAKKI